MLDLKAGKFTAKAKDWSTDVRSSLPRLSRPRSRSTLTLLATCAQLDASVLIKPFINYFNLKVSHWEPLMDPWEFGVNVRPALPRARS